VLLLADAAEESGELPLQGLAQDQVLVAVSETAIRKEDPDRELRHRRSIRDLLTVAVVLAALEIGNLKIVIALCDDHILLIVAVLIDVLVPSKGLVVDVVV
jgi:hypothetical protein